MNLLITGSSSGIGRFLAGHLLTAGHAVWGVARSAQAGFRDECARKNQRFSFSQGDVADWPQVARCRREVGEQWRHLDGVICCAGAQPPIGPAMTLDPQDWSTNIRLNLDGTFFTIRAFHDLLKQAPRRAKIICFSGGGAASPRPNFSAYAAAKAGVVRLVETLAQEWGAAPIDINAIAPGAINTKMTEEVLASGPAGAGEKEYAAALKQKETGGASLTKVAGLVDFLLSAEGDGISGRLLSAPWDPWPTLAARRDELAALDIYTLRRITPEDRGKKWSAG